MNMNRLINMITNQVVRRLVNMAINRGISFASRKSALPAKPHQPGAPQNDGAQGHVTTPAELAKDAELRSMAKQATKAARMARRLGR